MMLADLGTAFLLDAGEVSIQKGLPWQVYKSVSWHAGREGIKADLKQLLKTQSCNNYITYAWFVW